MIPMLDTTPRPSKRGAIGRPRRATSTAGGARDHQEAQGGPATLFGRSLPRDDLLPLPKRGRVARAPGRGRVQPMRNLAPPSRRATSMKSRCPDTLRTSAAQRGRRGKRDSERMNQSRVFRPRCHRKWTSPNCRTRRRRCISLVRSTWITKVSTPRNSINPCRTLS